MVSAVFNDTQYDLTTLKKINTVVLTFRTCGVYKVCTRHDSRSIMILFFCPYPWQSTKACAARHGLAFYLNTMHERRSPAFIMTATVACAYSMHRLLFEFAVFENDCSGVIVDLLRVQVQSRHSPTSVGVQMHTI